MLVGVTTREHTLGLWGWGVGVSRVLGCMTGGKTAFNRQNTLRPLQF